MLIDVCATLINKLDLLDEARSDTQAVDDYRQIRDALRQNSEALTSAFETLELFKKKAILIESLPYEMAMGLYTFFAEILGDYKNDTNSIRKRTFLLYQQLQKLAQLGLEVTNRLKMSWENHIDHAIEDLDTNYLEVLAAFAKFSGPINKIKSQLDEIDDLRDKLPATEGEINALNAIAKELARDWKSLELNGLPKSVYDFLDAVKSENGADLTKLSNEVRDWIRNNGLEGVFRVIIKRAD